MEGLTRGQLAQRAQINPETVRFYEQDGLLGLPSRTASGYRKFPEAAIESADGGFTHLRRMLERRLGSFAAGS
jgi:hypothetical protein